MFNSFQKKVGIIYFTLIISFNFSSEYKCDYCKKNIIGKYYFLEQKKYHEECYNQNIVPKCNFCKESLLGRYVVNEDGNYHNDCYKNNILPKCSVCIRPLEKEYNYDAWDNKYHGYHSNGKGNCSSCSRIISERTTNGGYIHIDGRAICNLCDKDIVNTKLEIEDSRKRVLLLLEEIGFQSLSNEIPIILKNRNELSLLMPHSSMISGLTNLEHSYKENYLGQISDEKKEYEIFILDKLNPIDFDSILAHEYLHVWLYENNLNYNSQITEGFCNLARAYIYQKNLDKYSIIQLNKMNEDPDLDYGVGYRIANLCLDNYGWNEMIKLFENNKAHNCF